MATMLILMLSLVLVRPAYAQEDSLQHDVAQAGYRIVGTGFFGGRSTLQKKLDEVSSQGYGVVRGLESELLMHRSDDAERRFYTAVGSKSDIDSVEQQMNAAAATGFRMVPDALLAARAVAVMEKRVVVRPVAAEYRLLSFKTHYEIGGIDHPLVVGGGFETDMIDERLAEMAVAGYRVIALAAQNADKCPAGKQVAGALLRGVLNKRALLGAMLSGSTEKRCQQLVVIFEKGPDAPVKIDHRAAARRYHVVIGTTETEFDARLNQAAAAGYRFLTSASNAFPAALAIVERQPPAAEPQAYRVLVPSKTDRMADELSEAAVRGWLPHARGVLDPSGGRLDMPRFLFVLERQQPTPPGALLVLDAMRSSTLASELNQAAADGFALFAAGASHGLKVLVLRRAGLPEDRHTGLSSAGT